MILVLQEIGGGGLRIIGGGGIDKFDFVEYI